MPECCEHGAIPRKIYCNKDIVPLLKQAFKNVNDRGLVHELNTWSGCFNIRKKRGAASMSLHSWGLAVDMNPSDNQFGKSRAQLVSEGRKPFSDAFVKCFTDAGFDWGGTWKKPDSMHFQIAKLP